MMRRRLKITFSSDWSVGSGAGIPGSVDRQVLRDADGLPYIPGKTLTGIMRDAAEFVADIRDGHESARRWRGVLISLFGTQPETHERRDVIGDVQIEARGAAIGMNSAELNADVRALLNDHRSLGLKQALFAVRPGVTIDRGIGRSEDGKLFSTERVRSDCELTASVIAFRELSGDERALLDDAVKAVRRIGGKRRRGAGCCRLAWIDDDWCETTFGEADNNDDLFAGSGDMTIRVRLTTLQPMIINRVTLGNEVKSEAVIPGTSLLPYLANDIFSAVDRDVMRKAVMNCDLSIGTLLPEFDGKQSLPVPLCLAEIKESGEKVNRMVSPQTYEDGKPVQMKDIRSGFVTIEDGTMTYHAASNIKVIRTHNTVEDETQHPSSVVGGLFTYEAIGAGNRFIGTLRIAESLADRIRALPSDERRAIEKRMAHDVHSFGRSRKDEYGEAELRCDRYVGDDANSYELIAREKGKYLVILLRSELLMRGSGGGYSVSLDDVRERLQNKLNVKLSDDDADWTDDDNGGSITPIGGCRGHSIRIDRRESWHRGWNLPRPSLLSFKAGSIFMFKVDDPDNWDASRARDLVRDGLGERRAEGYGEVMINPTFLFDANVRSGRQDAAADGYHANVTIGSLDSSDRRLMTEIAITAFMRRFRRTARRAAFDIVSQDETAPFENFSDVKWNRKKQASTSQFGALREAVASIEAIGDTAIFKQWAGSLRKRDSNKNLWDKHWIKMFEDLARDPSAIWDMLPELRRLRDDFLPLLKDLAHERYMGIFFDLLCEAVFDEAKRER